MDLSTITTDDFRAFFRRDFPYLPEFDPTKLYNSDAVTYYDTTELFYTCTADGTINILPTVFANWSKQKPQDDIDDYIQDDDITKAFAEAQVGLNQGLFGTDAQVTMGYLYLTAHYLCNDIKTSMRGISSSAMFPVSGRSVGNVAEQYGIPAAYLDSPILSFYTQSAYGMKYLALVLPQMVGNMMIVSGGTDP